MVVGLIVVVVVVGLVAVVATGSDDLADSEARASSARVRALPVGLVVAVAIGVIAWRTIESRDEDGPGAAAVWSVTQPPKASDTSFSAQVTRLGCSSGLTGHVRKPLVTTTDDQVTVTFTVDPLPDGAYTCVGNPSSTYVVELDEPIGDRELIDGACGGEAASTSYCVDGDG